MTDKKEQILKAALELFATEGFKSTSTSKVAKKAGVSEGLIFRHFINKDGLLEAILKEGEERVKILYADIIFESDPNKLLGKVFDMMLGITKSKADSDFWKLQYKIKWEIELYAEQKMEPLEHALTNAFEQLGYKEPLLEARHLLVVMDGIAMRYFLQESFDFKAELQFFRGKYKQ